jgi:exosortase A
VSSNALPFFKTLAIKPITLSNSIWTQHLKRIALSWAAIFALFWRDARDMAMIWWDSSTFNHCLLILPILWWLVNQRKSLLAKLTPQVWSLPLLYVAAGAGGWLLGDAAGLAVARQLGLLMMLQGSVAVILGRNITMGLLFPIFYMFFLLPFGEEFVPLLQTLTAKMCMVFLGWSGIPAHIDGIFISTPNGYFKVAEACSGVKFLVAMVAYGALVSNVCFRRWPRRFAFMMACVIVPIIANGIRAFGTIYIAQHSSVEFASGFDHVFYGWIFFGLVIAMVMAVSWRFFDRKANAPAFDPAHLQKPVRESLTKKKAMALLVAIIAAPILWTQIAAARPSPVPSQIRMPAVPGWQVVSYTPRYAWEPHFAGASHHLLGRYRNTGGQEVDLYIAVYDRQTEGRELIGFGQGSVGPESDWAWTADVSAPANGKAERITAPGPVAREVVSFYRVNGVTSGSKLQIKLAAMLARLFGGNQQATAIIVSAELNGNKSPRPAIDRFIVDLGDIDKVADGMAGLR